MSCSRTHEYTLKTLGDAHTQGYCRMKRKFQWDQAINPRNQCQDSLRKTYRARMRRIYYPKSNRWKTDKDTIFVYGTMKIPQWEDRTSQWMGKGRYCNSKCINLTTYRHQSYDPCPLSDSFMQTQILSENQEHHNNLLRQQYRIIFPS